MKYCATIIILIILVSGCVQNRPQSEPQYFEKNIPQIPQQNENHSRQQSPAQMPSDSLPSCGTDNNFFSIIPIILSDVTGIVPLGNFNPQGGHVFPTDHIYFYLRKPNSSDYDGAPIEATLYSPGNARIISVSASEHLSENSPYTDYSIDISPCKEIKLRFGHVTTISQKLKNQIIPPYSTFNEYTTGGKVFKMYSKTLNISITAGEILGTAGGRRGQNALDIGVYDARVKLSFANPSRWQQSDAKYAACPPDYFTPDAKIKMEAMLGNYYGNVLRTIPPICGEFAQDVHGTAQGVWFVKGTTNTYPEDPHLTLAHDNVDPKKGIFSLGTSIKGIQTGAYQFDPQNSDFVNRDFKDVKADGKIYCYELGNQFSNIRPPTVILQLTSNTTLRIETRDSENCGTGPWIFGQNYSDFER